MRTLLTLLLISSTAVAAPVPKEDKKLDPFAGKWNLRMIVAGGKAIDRTEDGIVWNIDVDHALTVTVAKSEEKVPAAAVKAPIGWAVTTSGPGPTPLKFDTARNFIDYGTGNLARAGKYALDGDTLTICLAIPGSPRPEQIERTDKSTTWVLSRVAK